jgi:hypothetical protein
MIYLKSNSFKLERILMLNDKKFCNFEYFLQDGWIFFSIALQDIFSVSWEDMPLSKMFIFQLFFFEIK